MQRYETMAALLEDARDRDRQITFIDGDRDESRLSFAGLWDSALAMLGHLQRDGMEAGDELVIFSRSNRRFVIAFWAAILGGIVPVPVAAGASDEHRRKLFRILGQLRKGRLFIEAEVLQGLREFAAAQGLEDAARRLADRVITDGPDEGAAPGQRTNVDPGQTAFIQYSSGSTSDPKGVCLSHDNLTCNIRAIVEGAAWSAEDSSLSWMPLTHDMGLIGYHLSVLAAGMNHAVMDTSVFVRRPLLWMQKAGSLGATQLCSPNFGYKHFLKLFERKGLDDLDLSAVRLILNGAEPISWELCESFLAALAPFGLKRSAMFPVYGLAEATVGVSFPRVGSEYQRIVVDRHQLRIGEPVVPLPPDAADAVSFVKVGRAIRDCEIRVVGDDDRPLNDLRVGHIQVSGGNVTAGLYHVDAAQAALFTPDGWLRTGDCGVIADGELVITGRSKDIIIVNGQNYYPHDIEEIVAGVDDLDLGKVVVCGVSSATSRAEELLVFVLYRQDVHSFRSLADSIRSRVGETTGLEVDHVIPVTRIPKTTSGKVQRAQLAGAYLDGEYDEVVAALQGVTSSEAEFDADPLVRELELICREFSRERVIRPDDNLFEVGVSSLTLTEIVLAIDEKHPGKVDISDLFDYPTIRQLADFMRQR